MSRAVRPRRPMGLWFGIWSVAAFLCSVLQKKLFVAYSFKYYITLGLLCMFTTTLFAILYASISGVRKQLPHLTRLHEPRMLLGFFTDIITFFIIALSCCLECVGTGIGFGELTMGGVAVVKNISPALTFLVGVMLGVERFTWLMLCAVMLLCGGIFVSVQGLKATLPGIIS